MSRHGWRGCARGARRVVLPALGAGLLVVAQVAGGLPLGSLAPVAARATSGSSGHPNLSLPAAGSGAVTRLPVPPPVKGPKPAYASPHAAPAVPMRAGSVALDPVRGARFTGSDGVLELTVPAGAVSVSGESLAVRQVLPPSGSNAGGSGHYSFGTWLVQVVDGGGRVVPGGLGRGLGVRVHEGGRAGALDLGHALMEVNPPLPSWVDL